MSSTISFPFDGQFSSEDLSATLAGLGKEAFFVQIGAMDGVTHDPIHPFVKRFNWSGMLVEPIPYLFKKLEETYAGHKGLIFANTAIADFDGQIEMAFIDPAKSRADVFKAGSFGTSTLMLDRGPLGGKGVSEEAVLAFKESTSVVEVPYCKLSTLLSQHPVKQIDLIVIDVEGADWMVARQIDIDKYHPRIVYLEYAHLTVYERIACAMHFHNAGYRVYLEKDNRENFLAVRP